MKNISTYDLVADVMSDEDLDELFSQLETFEAPEILVTNIMNAVAQLPLPERPTFVLPGYQTLIVEIDAATQN
ncbi:hypothetical protein [Tengunoibacter tsumagoiensis]|uniref:Uncharacterized protein n=1 Tax=Tengunoibacter tsumagoiensis TaxID=2014871 RepID=A0A401ZUP2_9CHLR|nr:hypothetical protein [Tengunoibacter tsumagoiensis]GCE10450.1 hypothetical protein KTT_03090 [Tengunoibacter tsumagoiensis]